ncbi:MAG TPA: ROK family protein [Stellaceae bacterium]|nr:ROK family protein [Stellaceae bacterium]
MQRATKPKLTLAIDIGGTGLKATLIDDMGKMTSDRLRVPTSHPAPPSLLVSTLVELVKPLSGYRRVSVGFPGVVRAGRVVTAPHLDTALWHGFDLADALASRLKVPVRVLNDADLQGYGAITGHGLEFVMTLGTGIGTALFQDGVLLPHLEISQHPVHGDKTYDAYIGNAVLESKGQKRWNRRVARVLPILETLIRWDHLHIGGGNAHKLTIALPAHARIVSNEAGLTGGIALWADGRGKTVS